MVECWHEVPSRRPTFAEIHGRLRHWEGFGGGGGTSNSGTGPLPPGSSRGYQSASHSMCNQSQHSGSHHSSTGPSNNTGSTNLSQQQLLQQQQQQQQFHHQYHHPQFMVQMAGGPSGANWERPQEWVEELN